MTLEEVENYFGNLNQACKALGIASQNMTKWRAQGYIPHKQQFRLAHLTEGELMPDEEDPHTNPRKGKKK
jgi:DNA-binding transcriptional regulator Cro